MKQKTLQRVASPTAILVSMAEPLATTVADLLGDGGMKVLRVGHVAAACERIPVTMPQIVVLSTTMRAEDADSIVDRCVAVGAEVLKIEPEADPVALAKTLEAASTKALVRSFRRGDAG